ncbi:MAG: nitroreductase family protein [Flavobacterium sp.]|uniref:nitroreductase family protein n=1 Tax=Flavobacterium sp. TaxID=239 RepID=UPI0035276D71
MQKIKNIIKKFIPKRFLEKRNQNFVIKKYDSYSNYDKELFLEHSNILHQETQLKYIGRIVQLYHIIEKGLTMPEMRLGFGQPKLINLIDKCLDYQKKYDTKNIQYQHAIGVIAEYKNIHQEHQFPLEESLLVKIKSILEKESDLKITKQLIKTKANYFEHQLAAFDTFSNSRHSIRNFSGTIKSEQIEEAIRLAQNTPTACNRQPIRVHIIENKELIAEAFKIQNGNRGFGHLVDKLLVITADISSYQDSEERNLPYVDGGMYTMNLLYALHFNKVAAIPLNWCRTKEEDLKMRKVISIPNSEIIIVFVGCGNLPDDFKLAVSKRYDYKDIFTKHN